MSAIRSKSLLSVLAIVISVIDSPSTASSSDATLEEIIDKVQANERLISLIRMDYTVEISRSIPRSEILEMRSGEKTGRVTKGEAFTHYTGVWAQDDLRQYANVDFFYGKEGWATGYIKTIDGQVTLWGTKPDLLQGSIDKIDQFDWTSVGPVHLGVRVLGGLYKLSEALSIKDTHLKQYTENIGGREAYVIDTQKLIKNKVRYHQHMARC